MREREAASSLIERIVRLWAGLSARSRAVLLLMVGVLLLLTPWIADLTSSYYSGCCPATRATLKVGVQPGLDPVSRLWWLLSEQMSAIWNAALYTPHLVAMQLIGLYLIFRGIRLLLVGTSHQRPTRRYLQHSSPMLRENFKASSRMR